MIQIKTDHEVQIMRQNGRILMQVFDYIQPYLVEGTTTQRIDCLIRAFILENGATPSFLNYRGFTGSSCISIDEEIIHGIPSATRRLQNGSLLKVDVGVYKNGFHVDAARTFCVGQVSPEKQHLKEAARQAFLNGLSKVKEGNTVGDIGYAVLDTARCHNLSVVREYTGHGVGANLHEDPNIPNFGRQGKGERLKANMCLAIEPMLNMGTSDINLLSDGWTVTTADGQPSAHYENTVLVTKNGYEVLTEDL